MGYFVLIISGIVVVALAVRKVREWSVRMKEEVSGNYLLVKKYESEGQYFGVFQQGDKEITAEIEPALYLQLQPPVRGFLSIVAGKVRRFE